MATTYAAYYNLATSANSSRKPSTTSTSSANSTKAQKVMNFLAPRIPLHEPLTPTHPRTTSASANAGQHTEREETEYAPARIYDSVLRRPLFQKARKGNEATRVSVSESRRSSKHSDDVHLSGTEYFGLNEKK